MFKPTITYTIPDNIWKEYLAHERKRISKDFKITNDKAIIPAEILTKPFKARIQKIFKKILKTAGQNKTLQFTSGDSAYSRPIISEDIVVFGTWLSRFSDGAVAAILGHELGHLVANTIKKELELTLSLADRTGQPQTLNDLLSAIRSIDPFTLTLIRGVTESPEMYLTNEMEVDRLGVQWALKAGFSKEEIKEMTALFHEGTPDTERIKYILSLLEEVNLTVD